MTLVTSFFDEDPTWHLLEGTNPDWVLEDSSPFLKRSDLLMIPLALMGSTILGSKVGFAIGVSVFAAIAVIGFAYRFDTSPIRIEVHLGQVVLHFRSFPGYARARLLSDSVIKSIEAKPTWTKSHGRFIAAAQVRVNLLDGKSLKVYGGFRSGVPEAYQDSRKLAQEISQISGFPFVYHAPNDDQYTCGTCSAEFEFGQRCCPKCGELIDYN
jgi:hypothetical protein